MEINKDMHFFCKMPKFQVVTPFGFGLVGEDTNWVECVIDEGRYKLKDNYKLTLKPTNPLFAPRHFYLEDFKSLLRNGDVLVKTKETQHIEFVRWEELLTPSVKLQHEGYVVVD